MTATICLAGSILHPEQVEIVQTAFERAWAVLEIWLPDDTAHQEAARLNLAESLLSIETKGPIDVLELRDQALLQYRARSIAMHRSERADDGALRACALIYSDDQQADPSAGTVSH